MLDHATALRTPAQASLLSQPTFRRLDATGTELAPDMTDGHVMTHFPALGIVLDVRKPRSVSSLEQAEQIAAECDLLGRKGEWILGEPEELQLLTDRSREAPAVNPAIAPNMPDGGWIYSGRKTAWSSDYVWFVYLLYGHVGWSGVDRYGFVVPVLRVPPSQ